MLFFPSSSAHFLPALEKALRLLLYLDDLKWTGAHQSMLRGEPVIEVQERLVSHPTNQIRQYGWFKGHFACE